MADDHKPSSVDGLIQEATQAVHQQQEQAAAQAAKAAAPKQGRQLSALVLLVLLAGVWWFQYPRIVEPYSVPDLNSSPLVVEAEMSFLSDAIEAYRLSQGRYPESLEGMRLPAKWTELTADLKPVYRLSGDSYQVQWKMGPWNGVLDGATRKIVVTRVEGAK